MTSGNMAAIQPIQSKLDFNVLISEQLAQIKSAMLHVLEKVGVRFPSE
jgi:trimethylamine:corrinoid methyltransferase-like protein